MEYHGANSESILRDQLINACRGVDKCTVALFRPAKTFEGVCADLKNAVSSHEVNKLAKSAFFTREREPDEGPEHMYVDRTYARGGQPQQGRTYSRGGRGGYTGGFKGRDKGAKKCYVCKKEEC